jgi:CBS domain-containing protein
MRARDLVRPYPTLSAEAPASGAVRLAAVTSVRSFLVIGRSGALIGVLSNTDILRAMLPSYVAESPTIASVLADEQPDRLWEHCHRKRVEQLVTPDAVVDAEATIVEVISVMIRTKAPLVGVVAEGRLLGGISLGQVLDSLPPPR